MVSRELGPAPFSPSDPLLRVATAMFIRDGWIDLRLLAKEAEIGRATLYRRYGDRDRILGEVLWGLAKKIMKQVGVRHRGQGASGIAHTVSEVAQYGAEMPAMRLFVSGHTETALRVLTSKHGVVQRRFIESIAALIDEELGALPDIDSTTLAFAVHRVSESFYYRELITGEPADMPTATIIIERLLIDPSDGKNATTMESRQPGHLT